MGVSRLPEPAGQGLIADDLVRVVAVRDECAVVVSETDAAVAVMLDRVRDELLYRRIRCVRVSAPLGHLSLCGLMAQILGRPEADAPTDGELKAGFTALVEPGAGHDRVALLIDGAHRLQLQALRYIQFACQSSPKLRVVLAGRPSLDSLLVRNEFGSLNQQIRQRFEFAGSPPEPVSVGRARRVPPRWLTSLNTGLGALASCALIASLALWVLPTGHSPNPPASLPTVPASDAATSVPEESTAPLATWTTRPADAPGPTEAPTPTEAAMPSTVPMPAAVPVAVPPAAVVGPPPAQPPAVPDQPPRLDLPPAEPMPEIRSADLESEPADLRKIEPAVPVDRRPSPAVTAGPAAPGRALSQPPAQPVRHVAAVTKQASAPDKGEEGRRCRDIVLNAQLGRTPSYADTLFLQGGCRAK